MVILSLVASRETSTEKAKLLRKKLCWTKATKERVGQQLRSHSFALHLRLTAPLVCGVPRAALDLKFEDPISN
jgi:hypothetical protein